MTLGFHAVLITQVVLGLVLFLLLMRLLQLGLRRLRATRASEQRRDLLYETLREQTLREQEATRGRNQAQRAYASLEEVHQTIMDHLPIGVLVANHAGGVGFVNRQAVVLFDLKETEGLHLRQVCPSLALVFSQLLAEGHYGPRTFQRGLPMDGSTLEITLCELPESRYLLMVADVTQLRRLEEQVRVKRDLELMGELASGVTHEVKNALAVISGHVQMLPYGDVAEHSRLMMGEIDQLLRFVRLFMQTSKGTALAPSPVPLRELFEDLKAHWAAHPLGASVRIEPPPEATICGEPALLTTVFNNLVLNALQSGGEAGPPLVVVEARVLAQAVEISVTDEGPGFAMEIRARLFTPFVSTKAGGTGLGLFQCRKIMLEHGGRLDVEYGPPTRVSCVFPQETLACGN